MFDISFQEITLVAIIALIIIGPEKLPALARTVGVWVGKARRMAASVKADIDRELQTDELRKMLTEQKAEMEELRHIIDENRTGIEADLNKINTDLAQSDSATAPKTPAIAEPIATTSLPPPQPSGADIIVPSDGKA